MAQMSLGYFGDLRLQKRGIAFSRAFAIACTQAFVGLRIVWRRRLARGVSFAIPR